MAETVFVVVIFLVIMAILYLVPALIVWWKLYSKAGQPGWGIIIPVYSTMLMAKIGKKPVWLGVIAGIIGLLAGYPDQHNQHVAIMLTLNLVSLILGIVLIVAMAKQYNRGIGFWLAAIFLPIVAVFMVNKTQYIGAQTPAEPAAPAAPTTSQNS